MVITSALHAEGPQFDPGRDQSVFEFVWFKNQLFPLFGYVLNHHGPCGLMDKAPDFGSGDCRFESCHGRNFSTVLFAEASFTMILATFSLDFLYLLRQYIY